MQIYCGVYWFLANRYVCKMGCERSLHTQWSSPSSWLKSLHTFNFPRVWEAFTHAGSHHPGYLCPMSRTQLCSHCTARKLWPLVRTQTLVFRRSQHWLSTTDQVWGNLRTKIFYRLEIFESLICVFKSEMFRRIPREQVSTVQWAGVAQKMSLLLLILRPSPSATKSSFLACCLLAKKCHFEL